VVAISYGALCHVSFAASVVMMIVSMYTGMQVGFGSVSPPWNWLANMALVLQFPLLHSILLTSRGRKLLSRLAPRDLGEHLSTTTYVIVASLQVLLLFGLWSPTGTVWWAAAGFERLLLSALYAIAWLLLLKSIADASLALHTGSLGWRAVWRGATPRYPSMPARGLFRLCRQPIYVSFSLASWTVPTWTPDQLVVAVSLTSYCLIGPLLKERRFRRLYGAEFDAYRRQVPYWLPRLIAPAAAIPNDQSIYGNDAADWWSGRHRWLRTMHNLVPPRLKYFDRIVGDWRGLTVLDLGCAGGFMAEPLARRGASVIGIDPSAPAVAAAREHARSEGLSIDFRVASGEDLPVPNESLDCVVVVDVLEHVADLLLVLNEIHRVLKPGGRILFDTVNRNSLASFIFIFLGERVLRLGPSGTHDPAKLIKPSELDAKLRQAGFDPGPMVGLGPRGFNRRLDVTFGRLPTKHLMYMGCATKIGAAAGVDRPEDGTAARNNR
jgi:ubiquinone biosynthesis O-methyltransferase